MIVIKGAPISVPLVANSSVPLIGDFSHAAVFELVPQLGQGSSSGVVSFVVGYPRSCVHYISFGMMVVPWSVVVLCKILC